MWIVNKRYDIAFIFGGAAASLTVPFLVIWKPALLPALFWGWLLIFDGTHLWAAYSRTYVDRQFWRTDRKLLLMSPLLFLLPLSAVAIWRITESMDPVNLFLLFAQGWAYYHVVRQHYGFESIYDRKSGADSATHQINKWTLYTGLWTPYLYFVASHPVNRYVVHLPPMDATRFPESLIPITAASIALSNFVRFFLFHRRNRTLSSQSVLFVSVCLIVYSFLFFVIAPMEPFFSGARNVVQSFMLIGIMMTLFHNIQYHAIVWHYNRRKYHGASDQFWLASRLNRNFVIYAIAGVLFSTIYVATAWFSTEYPSLTGRLLNPVFVPAAFCLWWGLLFHHYYLDQKIWRLSKTKDLRDQLGIAA